MLYILTRPLYTASIFSRELSCLATLRIALVLRALFALDSATLCYAAAAACTRNLQADSADLNTVLSLPEQRLLSGLVLPAYVQLVQHDTDTFRYLFSTLSFYRFISARHPCCDSNRTTTSPLADFESVLCAQHRAPSAGKKANLEKVVGTI